MIDLTPSPLPVRGKGAWNDRPNPLPPSRTREGGVERLTATLINGISGRTLGLPPLLAREWSAVPLQALAHLLSRGKGANRAALGHAAIARPAGPRSARIPVGLVPCVPLSITTCPSVGGRGAPHSPPPRLERRGLPPPARTTSGRAPRMVARTASQSPPQHIPLCIGVRAGPLILLPSPPPRSIVRATRVGDIPAHPGQEGGKVHRAGQRGVRGPAGRGVPRPYK
jgi:hypothetical protein